MEEVAVGEGPRAASKARRQAHPGLAAEGGLKPMTHESADVERDRVRRAQGECGQRVAGVEVDDLVAAREDGRCDAVVHHGERCG